MTVTNVAVATTKSLFGMYDCTVDGDVGTGRIFVCAGDFAPVATCTCDRTYLRAWTDVPTSRIRKQTDTHANV